MSYVQRLIAIDFTLGPNPQTGAPRFFPESGTDTITLSGLRTSVEVRKAGSPGLNEADIRVWGMTRSQMLALHTYGQIAPGLTGLNMVTVRAGDAASGMSQVFFGTISSGWVDATGAPDVCFRVAAQAGLVEAMTTIPDISIKGWTDSRTIMARLANLAGLDFEDSLPGPIMEFNPHYSGTARAMMLECASHNNFGFVIDDGVVAIYPAGGARNVSNPTIGPGRGMVGYPTFTPSGVVVSTLFNRLIRHAGSFTISGSTFDPANRTWAIARLDHNLESQVPHGKWFTTIYGWLPGLGVVGNG